MANRKPLPRPEEVLSNREAELAVLHLICTCDESETDMLFDSLDERDFRDQDTRAFFVEFADMRHNGYPLDDKASWKTWFGRADVRKRLATAGVDQGKPFYALLELVIEGAFGALAHREWYIRELRRWRQSRGIEMLCHETMHRLVGQPAEPKQLLAWLRIQLDELENLDVDSEAS